MFLPGTVNALYQEILRLHSGEKEMKLPGITESLSHTQGEFHSLAVHTKVRTSIFTTATTTIDAYLFLITTLRWTREDDR